MAFVYNNRNHRRRSRIRNRSKNRNNKTLVNVDNSDTKKLHDLASTLNEKEPAAGITNFSTERKQKMSGRFELSFNCQLANGSPVIKVTNFSSVAELFDQIASGFNINPDDIIFCTINTYNVEMDKLFTGSIEQNDMLFVHLRGQPVEVELTKKEETLGVTIADNGLCCAFFKRIKENSVAEAAKPALATGQMIESIQGESVLGLRHYEVARVIRALPIGQSFVMRLVNPLQSGFNFIRPRSKQAPAHKTEGMGTIRFKANGGVVVQEETPNKKMIEKLNELFDTYLGVQDDELAQTIWDTAQGCSTLQEMIKAVRNSSLQVFNFPDELVFDIWGIISDLLREKKQAR